MLMPSGIAIPQDDWKEAKRAIKNGELYPDCAARLGIRLSTLRRRAAREEWDSPARRVRKRDKAAGDERTARIPPDAPDATNSQLQQSRINDPDATNSQLRQIRINDLPDLLAAADSGPEAYRAALQRWGQLTVAGAIPDIPPPRTLAELKTVVDIIDKQTPKGPTAGNQIRHASRLSRAVIDVDPVPEVDGFRI